MTEDETTPAIHCGARRRTHAEARARAARLATGLRALGVGPGDRFALVLRNEIEFLEATMAAAPLGAVPVPVNWHWTGADLEHLLHDSGAKVVLVHTDLLPAVEKYAPEGTALVEVATTAALDAAYSLGSPELSGRHPTRRVVRRNAGHDRGRQLLRRRLRIAAAGEEHEPDRHAQRWREAREFHGVSLPLAVRGP